MSIMLGKFFSQKPYTSLVLFQRKVGRARVQVPKRCGPVLPAECSADALASWVSLTFPCSLKLSVWHPTPCTPSLACPLLQRVLSKSDCAAPSHSPQPPPPHVQAAVVCPAWR
jgi:hypothetical protein